MATAAQLLANQTNARQSTGPQTVEGKHRSAQNARKHGLFISDACLRLECPQEWADTLADYLAEHCPATATERQLVYQLTLATLRQRRLERIETSLVNQHSPTSTRPPPPISPANKPATPWLMLTPNWTASGPR